MTMKRTGDAWMSADEYGRALPQFSVNLLVRDLSTSLPFYEQVLGATVRYSDSDFAAMVLHGVEFMLHADHTYDHHPLYTRLQGQGKRGTGAEIRVMGIDQPVADFPHGWRDVILEDPDGYIWAVGVPLKK
jgi:catechol 2,3-dioxygenase-like lactoylglutathione lyase family enzyme